MNGRLRHDRRGHDGRVHDCVRDHDLARVLADIAPVGTDIGLDDALAAYRRSRAFRRGRRRATPAVATLLTVTSLSLSGGVAAAYAASLPRPVQRVAHHLLAHLGVPAPEHEEPARRQATRIIRPRPLGTAVVRPPTVAPVPVRAATMTVGAPSQVSYAGSATVVASAPTSSSSTFVQLLELRPDGTWAVVTSARAGAGTVRFHVRVTRTLVLGVEPAAAATRPGRRPTRPAPTSRVVVQMVPRLTATASMENAADVVAVRARGVAAGDRVYVARRTSRGLTTLGTARFTRDGRATFQVAHTTARASYVVLLPATPRHARVVAAVARVRADVSPPTGARAARRRP